MQLITIVAFLGGVAFANPAPAEQSVEAANRWIPLNTSPGYKVVPDPPKGPKVKARSEAGANRWIPLNTSPGYKVVPDPPKGPKVKARSEAGANRWIPLNTSPGYKTVPDPPKGPKLPHSFDVSEPTQANRQVPFNYIIHTISAASTSLTSSYPDDNYYLTISRTQPPAINPPAHSTFSSDSPTHAPPPS
ncbi:hypothetical protein BT63DRAFT_456613 [Microthyrium microscopicum]|uniref:Uncharacterized protein n=1 Tax=Microthyrium microscopicum TaxID=703497 RepID=A0A6A6U890_9PEZI|nr:hypothetical protein BT63DRAFT_456613 [Microthyrium microscopicum]